MLVVCDTLRQDLMGLYGGSAKTPFLNAFSKETVVYRNAIAPSSWTFPSHVSLLTGLYPGEHKVHETKTEKLLKLTKFNVELRAERISEYLKRNGYNTLGISNNPMVGPVTYFDVGFDFFFSLDPFPISKKDKTFEEARQLGASPGAIAKALLKKGQVDKLIKFAQFWLRNKSMERALNFPLDKGSALTNKILANGNWESKFFKFINLMEVHEPYEHYKSKEVWDNVTGIRKMRDKSIREIKSQYMAEIEYLDSALSRLVKTLKSKDLYDDTLIIITSDHGQAMNEHGYMLHSTYLYDELTRIPMIVKYPHGKRYETKKGYQNLTSIPKLIKNIIEGGDDSPLTNEATFSEAFGAVIELPGGYERRKNYVKNTYEKVRKTVYKNGFKMTVNGTDGTIEEFMKGNKDVPIKDNKTGAEDLLQEIDIFKGNERFLIPDITK